MGVEETYVLPPALYKTARFLEIFGLVYTISPVIVAYAFDVDPLLGHSKQDWLIFNLILAFPTLGGLFIIRMVLGNDFRLQLGLHSVAFLIVSATFFYGFHPNLEEVGEPLWAVLLRYGLFILISTAIFVSMTVDWRYHIRNIAQYADALNQGDYSYRITDPKTVEDRIHKDLIRALNNAIEIMENLVKNLNTTEMVIKATEQLSNISTDISASSEEVASSSQNMAEVANQQAQHVQEIFDSIGSLDKTIKQVIEQITTNSQVVSQIALQTNILALNAGIEASRAGDYGRGFTVVANNVRKLSEESKTAAENIIKVSELVSESLKTTFNHIRDKIEDISALSEETAASSEEVASVAEEMTSSMEEMNASTNELAEMANKMKKYIEINQLKSLLDN